MAALEPVGSRRGFRLSLIVLSGLTVLALGGRVALLGAGYGLDYNEGWNAFQVQNLVAGRAIYTAPEALSGSNYPPLSFLLVALLAKAGFPIVVAGRVMALMALVGTGGAVFVAVRRLLPADPRAGWLGALLFAGYNATVLRYYVGIYDPQWLAQALAAWGLVLVLTGGADGRLSTGRALSAAGLIALSMLVKHNVLAIPIATVLWLAMHDRRALALWLAVALGVGGMVLFADRVWSDSAMIAAILRENRVYSVARLVTHGALVASFAPLIAIAWPVVRGPWQDRRLSLLAIGVPTSLALGLLGSAGEGVDVNAWFDAVVMLSIAAPVGLALRAKWNARKVALALAPVGLLLPWSLAAGANEVMGRGRAEAHHREMVARIARIEGPVACDNLIYCFSADKEFAMDFFRLRQRMSKGHDPAAVRDAWRRRNIVAIQLESPPRRGKPNGLDILIAKNFAPIYQLDGRTILERTP